MLLLATVVGCNYAGTASELGGCVNDAFLMRQILVRQFGFEERNVTLLVDNNDHMITELPTGANIKRALAEMVQRARGVRRAHLFFHFSGHGTLVRGGPYVRPHDAIVPSDFNLITDVDFRRLVDQVPQTATFTMVSDSCHSGGLIAQEREQIGPTGTALNRAGGGGGRTRFLPYETVLQHLGVARLHQLERHMVASFGEDASALFRHARAPVPVPRPDSAILLSACQLNEAAEEQDNYGAFTLKLVALLSRPNDWPTGSNWEVVTIVRYMLQQSGFTQHPCLYCSDDNVGGQFLSRGLC